MREERRGEERRGEEKKRIKEICTLRNIYVPVKKLGSLFYYSFCGRG